MANKSPHRTADNEADLTVPPAAHGYLLAVETALCDLESPDGLSLVEAVLAEGIRQAARRLNEFGARIAADGAAVPGSMGQLRPHPLLAGEQKLRREIAEQLRQLERSARTRRQFERLKAMTRSPAAQGGKP